MLIGSSALLESSSYHSSVVYFGSVRCASAFLISIGCWHLPLGARCCPTATLFSSGMSLVLCFFLYWTPCPNSRTSLGSFVSFVFPSSSCCFAWVLWILETTTMLWNNQWKKKNKALNWGMAPPPSQRDPVEAESASGLVLVGRVFLERDLPLMSCAGGSKRRGLFFFLEKNHQIDIKKKKKDQRKYN